MKLKHNKLRNTGLLFELLVRQITSDTLNNRESKAVDILKNNFNNNAIAKEYKIYKAILTNKNLSEGKANIVIESAIQAHKKLNKSILNNQKYKLISQIKENYDIEEFFKSKIDNYKTLASVYMLFEMYKSDSIDPQNEVKFKFSIMEDICDGKKEAKKDPVLEEYESFDKGTKALVYKLMVQKFNEKYSEFNASQRRLLKEYINSITTPETFKDYVNEELGKLKTKLTTLSKKVNDEVRKIKIQEVINIIKPVSQHKQVCDLDLENLLHYYELEKELENV